MLPSGVVIPPSWGAGIGSPSLGVGSDAPAALPLLAPCAVDAAAGGGVRYNGSLSRPHVDPATPRAYVRGCSCTASRPTSRSQRSFVYQPFSRSDSATRSTSIRGLALPKNSSSVIPYERYGSCG